MEIERILQRALCAEEALEAHAPRKNRSKEISHWSRAILMEQVSYLKEMARFSQGSAQQAARTLDGHPIEFLHLARTTEFQANPSESIVLFVLAGTATLRTSVAQSKLQSLRAGDFLCIPAGLSYQMEITGEESISCIQLRLQAQIDI